MSQEIIIRGIKYDEQINYQYQINFDKDIINHYIKPNFQEDEDERKYILSRIENEIIPLLKKDNNTRQACFSILYPNNLGHCISLIHIMLRNNTIILNEYYRSQNYELNRKYDDQTACMIIDLINKFFPQYNNQINVFVGSYHKEIIEYGF